MVSVCYERVTSEPQSDREGRHQSGLFHGLSMAALICYTPSVRVSIILHQQIAYVLVRRTAMFLVLARNFSGTQLAHAEKFSSDSNDRV